MERDKYYFLMATHNWDSLVHKRTTIKKSATIVEKTEYRKTKEEFPLWQKSCLTVEEAAAYSGIGKDKLRQLTDDENCPFVLWNGTKRLIKRKNLDEYLDKAYSI